jgi:hypothetical protein
MRQRRKLSRTTSIVLNGSTDCWRAPRRAETTRCEKLIVTAARLAAARVDQSRRLRTQNFKTSRPMRSLRRGAALTTNNQRRANRANATASTGPKTKTGKLRSARNALRHGLNIPILNRVRACRAAIVTKLLAYSNYQPDSVLKQMLRLLMMSERGSATPFGKEAIEKVAKLWPPLEGDEKLAAILEDQSSELARPDRYERRALSRRNFAIRMFDAGRFRES